MLSGFSHPWTDGRKSGYQGESERDFLISMTNKHFEKDKRDEQTGR
jgi:hypothetical protein